MPEIQPNFTGRPTGGPHSHLFREHAKPADSRKTTRRILAYLGRRGRRLAVVFLCASVTTVISIAGTRLNGFALDGFIVSGDILGLGGICLVMLGMYAVNVLSTYLQNTLMISAAQSTSADIRRDLFIGTQRLPVRYFDTHSSGDLMSRLTNDVDNINLMLSQGVVQLFSGIVNVAGMLIAMALLSPLLTAIALAMTPLMFISTRMIVRKAQPWFVMQQRELGSLNGFVEEKISAQKTISLFSQERNVETDFSSINGRYVRSSARAQALSGIIGPLNNLLNNTTYLIIAVCGGILIVKGTGITVGVIFSFLLYMRHFTRPINDIMNLSNTVQSALAGGERIFDVIDAERETDCPDAKDVRDFSGSVIMDRVDFSYVPRKRILKGASLRADPGQTIAIVGPTGAGKTTIINLLTKFYGLDGGSIRIDGTEIGLITAKSLREGISIVLQDTFLFSDTVRENIRYGRLTADDADIERAAKQARAHEFILQLPDGYDTVLSDNGSNLSQGQRQLLGIARAVIARSSILILDEATSSVDTRTELLIQEALLSLMRGKTCFVIAHRLSTIRKADRIAVINDGAVVESGTHEELIASDGFYARLYSSQFASGLAL